MYRPTVHEILVLYSNAQRFLEMFLFGTQL